MSTAALPSPDDHRLFLGAAIAVFGAAALLTLHSLIEFFHSTSVQSAPPNIITS